MITLNRPTDKLNEYLVKALALHLIILFLAYIGNAIFDMNLFQTRKPEIKLNIVQEAVRVDIVGLPKHTLQELKKMNLQETPPVVQEETKSEINETSKIEFKKKANKVNLSNLLNNLSKKNVVKKIKKQKKKENLIDDKELNNLILEGNKVSKGSSTHGDVSKAVQEKFIQYIQGLPDKVRPFWKLPSYLLNQDLTCRVRVFVSSSGQVLKTEVFESSGEVEYDKKAQEAVLKASPFPRPAPEILSSVTTGNIILGFPL